MSKNSHFYEIVAGADNSRAMESETIQKNGASPKSHTSRRNLIYLMTVVLLLMGTVFTACKKDKDDKNQTEDGVVINGVRWSTRNLDKPGTFVANPEDAGMFYQWNRKVGWSNTDPMINSNGGTTWDNSTPTGNTWEKANDPSPAGWHVPTLDELRSLIDDTYVTRVWTNINGIYGYRFTDRATGASTFLPAADFRSDRDGLLAGGWDINSEGNYWSSTSYDDTDAYYSGFHSKKFGVGYIDNRMRGFSVRCVADK